MMEMLRQQPHVVNASWDWGGGDWENGLQAAEQTGSREMALFLLEQGGRLDLPAAAMLGLVDLLKSARNTPGFLKSCGAHEIPLLSHAVAGGGESRAALDFLFGGGALT